MIITTNLDQAISTLRQGNLVAFPTETVYGLGADAKNAQAVAKIFAAKKRPLNHPLIVHIAEISQLQQWVSYVPEYALELAKHFWPGPLTLVLPKQAHVLDMVTGNQTTIGLRIPAHPIAQTLLQQFGSGLAAPSANQFTRISPTTAQAVADELGNEITCILDGGACAVGLESTIIDCSGRIPQLLRPGMLSVDFLNQVLIKKIKIKSESTQRAPGMHLLHYAPRTKTRVIKNLDFATIDQPAVVLTINQISTPQNIDVIKMPTNANDYARLLYFTLRNLDSRNYQCIYIEDVPENNEWDAIRDRIHKASFGTNSL